MQNLEIDRNEDSHKGENGRVAVIAGSQDYTGAPALAAEAAMRTGCDLTRILTAEDVKDTVAGFSENLIVESYRDPYFSRESVSKAEKLVEWSDCCIIGPGMGDLDPKAIEELVSKAEKPFIIDADAIAPVIDADLVNAVLTPHRGETEKIEQKFGSLEKFVKQKGSTLVLKGSTDRIYTASDIFKNETGTAAMTVGGTGDTLTGIIGSLVSQGLSLEKAAREGTRTNGVAGELAETEYGNGMLATDLLEKIPEAMKK